MFKIINTNVECDNSKIFRVILGDEIRINHNLFPEFDRDTLNIPVGSIVFLEFIIKEDYVIPKHVPTNSYEDFKEGKALIILIIGILPEHRHNISNLLNLYNYIEEYAKTQNCEMIVLESPRQELHRGLPKLGFVYCPHYYKWVKEL